MPNLKISELPAAISPVASTDVLPVVQAGVTKKAAINQLGFLQSGTGSVTRTTESKLRDVVSVKDFGAVGNGVTDDTIPVTNSLNAATSYLPSGVFLTTTATKASLSGRTFGLGAIQTNDGNRTSPTFVAINSAPASLGNHNSILTAFNGDL